ncbi:MAG: hypothetical protein EXS18_00450 [Verrucomicrobiae bacterium]|nr:hypothetical protein [Verrucomicrobiae bacterium]
MSNARSQILDRVRTALKHKAPQREMHGEPKPWFPPIALDVESLIARFKQEHETLKGEFVRAPNTDAARRELHAFFERNSIRKIAASADSLLRDVLEGQEVRWIDANSKAGASLDGFDLGVTRADALAARTGSIFLTSRSGSGRALSVLPPIHLVVATKEELVVDLSEGMRVWQRKYGNNWPSNCFIISGPSRTADIEKVLVLGAHGPKRLVTLLLG